MLEWDRLGVTFIPCSYAGQNKLSIGVPYHNVFYNSENSFPTNFYCDKLSAPENPIFESKSMSLRWVWRYREIVLCSNFMCVARYCGGVRGLKGGTGKQTMKHKIVVGVRYWWRWQDSREGDSECRRTGCKRLAGGPQEHPLDNPGCFLAIFISRFDTSLCNMHWQGADQQGACPEPERHLWVAVRRGAVGQDRGPTVWDSHAGATSQRRTG